MLSTVYELAETEVGQELVFTKVLVLSVAIIIALAYTYHSIRNH